MTIQEKRIAYKAGKWAYNGATPYHALWNTDDWVAFIDSNGVWLK